MKSVGESRPSVIHYLDLQAFWEESWRPDETCGQKVLNLVSMKDAVMLSTRMRRFSPLFWCSCVVDHWHVERGHYRMARFSAFRLSSFWSHERGFKWQTLCQWRRSEKLQWYCGAKNIQQNFTRQGYMLSFEDGILLFRETVTLLRSRNVIHRETASFWCMIHVFVSVIIPVVKKKMLLLDSSTYDKKTVVEFVFSLVSQNTSAIDTI